MLIILSATACLGYSRAPLRHIPMRVLSWKNDVRSASVNLHLRNVKPSRVTMVSRHDPSVPRPAAPTWSGSRCIETARPPRPSLQPVLAYRRARRRQLREEARQDHRVSLGPWAGSPVTSRALTVPPAPLTMGQEFLNLRAPMPASPLIRVPSTRRPSGVVRPVFR
jgi:hypothetical protein